MWIVYLQLPSLPACLALGRAPADVAHPVHQTVLRGTCRDAPFAWGGQAAPQSEMELLQISQHLRRVKPGVFLHEYSCQHLHLIHGEGRKEFLRYARTSCFDLQGYGALLLLLKGRTSSKGFDILEYTNTRRKQQVEKHSLVVNVYSFLILLTWENRALVKSPTFKLSTLKGGYLCDPSSRRNVQKVRESHPDQTDKCKLPTAEQTAVISSRSIALRFPPEDKMLLPDS